jgi:hypothetical protein
MHCTEEHVMKAWLLRPFAVVALGISALLLLPAGNAQMNAPQARPPAQPPQTQSPRTQPPQSQSPSPTISDEKLNAAAAAVGQVATIRQSYERKIATAPEPDKQRLAEEANDALERRSPTRASRWMNTIALFASPKMTPRCAKNSRSVFLVPANRGVEWRPITI